MGSLARACDLFTITISVKRNVKLVAIYENGLWPGSRARHTPSHQLNEDSLNAVDNFVHLGSILSSTLSLDEELNAKLGKASPAFGRLSNKSASETENRIRY